MSIREAVSAADYAAFGTLIAEYVDWCRERYAADPWLVGLAFSHQSLDQELEVLGTTLWPARWAHADRAGWSGDRRRRRLSRALPQYLRDEADACRPCGWRKGHRRALCKALLDQAADNGFGRMVLDTTRDMTEAIGLYRSFGFADCEPYIDYPDRMKPMMVFMEKALGPAP